MIHEFSSLEELKSFFAASMVHTEQIPELLKDDFLEDFCEEFLKLSDCKRLNRISLSFWCLEVFAFKK